MLKMFTIKLRHTKRGEIERFDNWKGFYQWMREVMADEVRDSYMTLEGFERQGFEDEWDWFTELGYSDLNETMWQMNYDLTLEKGYD